MPDELKQSMPSRSLPGRTPTLRGRLIRYALPGVLVASMATGIGLGVVASPASDAVQALPATPVADSVAQARTQDRPSREDARVEIAPEAEAREPQAPAAPAAQVAKLVVEQAAPQQGGTQSSEETSSSAKTATVDKAATVAQPAAPIAKRSCGALPGVTANAEKVHQAACARFPGVTSYGGVRAGNDGYHSSGRAVDIMLPNTGYGQQIADYMRANASSLGVTEVIFNQRIWTTQRASEGWRSMSNRGSATANHMDHVHVSVR